MPLAAEWLYSKLHKPHPQVVREEIDRRAAICQSCPMHDNPCVSCQGTRRRLVQLILRKKPYYPVIGNCGVIKSDLSADIEMVQGPDLTPALPDTCWKRTAV